MATGENRTLSLAPEHAEFVRKSVESGRYRSANEVIRTAMDLLVSEETQRDEEMATVRKMIQEGADQLDRGDVVDGEAFFREWEGRHRAMQKATPRNGR